MAPGADEASVVRAPRGYPRLFRSAGRPRHGKDLLSLFKRQPRRNKRPRFEGRFYHQYAGRQAGNDPVAGWRVSCRRLRSDGLIRYHGPCLADTGLQFRVFGRADDIDPARDTSNRPGCERAQMGRAVNAAGEPRHDHIARVPEIGGYFRQFGDGCRGRSITLDQFYEGAGPYRRRADQAQPVNLFRIREPGGVPSMPPRWRGCRVRLTFAEKIDL